MKNRRRGHVSQGARMQGQTFVSLNRHEAKIAAALFERLFPEDVNGPGAIEIGVLSYLDRALAGPYRDKIEWYRLELASLNRAAIARTGKGFAECPATIQDELIGDLERGEIESFQAPSQVEFFGLVRAHLQEGLFADPIYGGNRDKLGWKVLGHPGVWLENSAEENLTSEPVTKSGRVQSLADVIDSLHGGIVDELPGFEPTLGASPPSGRADVVIVGVGSVGGLIAPIFARAGLRVVGLEAGPWRTTRDFVPDELGAAYYCRAMMGPKFLAETPRWRLKEEEPTNEATFSLGRMMNSVGGSVIHYGAWLRRFHPHHFVPRTRVLERWGSSVLPEGSTVADWPVSYDELEPSFCRLEWQSGVSAEPDSQALFAPRSAPPPLPPLRPFRLGELFRKATSAMGLHPHMVPAGMNSKPYQSRPATTYTAWSNGFGSFNGDKWHPGMTCVPEALATGNFELRTHCRVVRILTKGGRASGVEYIDANGIRRVQEAEIVILSGYTFENVRLMLLSGDEKHQSGLGNNSGQVGRHFMTKMFAHVDGLFPAMVFNRHTGPAAQGVVVDDYLSDAFDCVAEGFLGGATLGAENQFLPIQISRESLPPLVPRWGSGYKQHLLNWQHFGVVRIQPDALPYESNFLDLDPVHRDKSGIGMPVIRVTYDLKPNERHLADWAEGKAEEVLRAIGATETWRGPSFTGVGSSHDLGGCRMGDDPSVTVVDRDLQVHDTPGLFVYSGAVFPSCPGINPTLTLWTLATWAAERLATKLQTGKEL
jgi:gluconate 2-dehydrogenase alpha chain